MLLQAHIGLKIQPLPNLVQDLSFNSKTLTLSKISKPTKLIFPTNNVPLFKKTATYFCLLIYQNIENGKIVIKF